MAYTTIDNPELYFQTKIYTGNGSTQSITLDGSEDMRPDWIWIKNRPSNRGHTLVDSVRGVSKTLESHTNGLEETHTNSITSFDSDGFSLGNRNQTNANSESFVSWNWLAGGSASSNSDGSITSSVSANTTAGFSIVSYTGTGSAGTIGHGLGSAPSVIWTKTRSSNEQWFLHFSILGTGSFIKLDTTDAAGTNTTAFPFNPQASTFGLSTDGATNTSGRTYIAYCFAEKKGYSKFGTYTGNGNSDGTFVFCGFRPAWVMIKRTDTTSDWNIMDNKRAVSVNPNTKELYANSNQAEATGGQTIRDYLSNGFKLRGTSGGTNASGGTYIYMAFAESPFVNSNGVPTNAR